MSVPGNAGALSLAQRVELRRCPLSFDPHGGTLQIAAWQRNAKEPTLIDDVEDSGVSRYVIIEGVYVFEFMGGQASQIVVIIFKDGLPRIVLRKSSRHEAVIRSTASLIAIDIPDSPNGNKHYEFPRRDSGARR